MAVCWLVLRSLWAALEVWAAVAVAVWDADAVFDAWEVAAFVCVVAVFTASRDILRLTTPARPPFKGQEAPVAPGALEDPGEPDVPPPFRAKPPTAFPAAPAIMVTLFMAIMASAIMEPPVWPTVTPMLARKLSIFCDTFRKPTAQRNQISTFPVTDSRLDALIWASTSLSVMAKAGTVRTTDKARTVEKRIMNL